MAKLNINCNGPDTIQDTIEIPDGLAEKLLRALDEKRIPVFTLVHKQESFPLNQY